MNNRKFKKWLLRSEYLFREAEPGDAAGIQRVLNGSNDGLAKHLSWVHSPQGFIHWGDVFSGRRKLSKRGRAFLAKLRDALELQESMIGDALERHG